MSSTPRDLAILKAVADVVREHVGKSFKVIADRLSLVETRSLVLADEVAELRTERPEKGEKGEPGKSVTAEDVLPALKDHVAALVSDFPLPSDGKDGQDGRDGKDGKSITPDDVFPLIEAKFEGWARDFERHSSGIVQRAIERIPEPPVGRDGRDGKDADPDVVAAKVIERLDLKGTRTDMKRLCAELVSAEIEKMPKPKDGKDGIDGKDGADGRDGIDGKDGAPGISGKDGADGVDGKDGESVTPEQIDELVEKRIKARSAEWALDFEKRAQEVLQKAIDRIEKPKDGRDGFSLDNFDIKSTDGGRTWVLTFDDGHRHIERTIVTEMPQYQDIWKDGNEYALGDMVTYGGSTWICRKPNKGDKPGSFSKAWKLIVKKGRDGASK